MAAKNLVKVINESASDTQKKKAMKEIKAAYGDKSLSSMQQRVDIIKFITPTIVDILRPESLKPQIESPRPLSDEEEAAMKRARESIQAVSRSPQTVSRSPQFLEAASEREREREREEAVQERQEQEEERRRMSGDTYRTASGY